MWARHKGATSMYSFHFPLCVPRSTPGEAKIKASENCGSIEDENEVVLMKKEHIEHVQWNQVFFKYNE